MHHLRREVIAIPFRIEDLRLAVGLLGIGDILALQGESSELPDADFRAAHPDAVLHARQSRLFAFERLTIRPRLSAPFDARGPLLLFRRAAHHELARRQVNNVQRDAFSKIDPLGFARRRFGGVERDEGREQQCGEECEGRFGCGPQPVTSRETCFH